MLPPALPTCAGCRGKARAKENSNGSWRPTRWPIGCRPGQTPLLTSGDGARPAGTEAKSTAYSSSSFFTPNGSKGSQLLRHLEFEARRGSRDESLNYAYAIKWEKILFQLDLKILMALFYAFLSFLSLFILPLLFYFFPPPLLEALSLLLGPLCAHIWVSVQLAPPRGRERRQGSSVEATSQNFSNYCTQREQGVFKTKSRWVIKTSGILLTFLHRNSRYDPPPPHKKKSVPFWSPGNKSCRFCEERSNLLIKNSNRFLQHVASGERQLEVESWLLPSG